MNVADNALWIAGVGYHVPGRVVTNADLERMMNTTDEFIVTRTGVRERRHASAGQSLNDLMLPAAKRALEKTGIGVEEIDAIIVSTLSPDFHDPSQACLLQAALGAPRVPAFDIRAQCSGMLYGMEIARGLLAGGGYRCILLVCGEMLSKRIDCSDEGRNLGVLMGDGAGALVLTRSSVAGRGLADLRLGADGAYFDLLCTAAPGSRNARFMDEEAVRDNRHHFRMKGAPMFEHACDTMVTATQQLLREHHLLISDIDLLVPHQPNLRILEAVLERLGLERERCVLVVESLGNVASASLPIALGSADERGALGKEKTILFLAYGAGATWGVGLYRS